MPMFLEYLLMFSLMICDKNCVCLIGKRLKKKFQQSDKDKVYCNFCNHVSLNYGIDHSLFICCYVKNI